LKVITYVVQNIYKDDKSSFFLDDLVKYFGMDFHTLKPIKLGTIALNS